MAVQSPAQMPLQLQHLTCAGKCISPTPQNAPLKRLCDFHYMAFLKSGVVLACVLENVVDLCQRLIDLQDR